MSTLTPSPTNRFTSARFPALVALRRSSSAAAETHKKKKMNQNFGLVKKHGKGKMHR
jgi:hypothetical protein